jgi:TetR/AcrR family transcriptional repressor of uid operon
MARVIKDRLIDAAIEEFSRSGFRAARMQDVARRAKVGDATLYRVFATKEMLYAAAMQRSRERNACESQLADILTQNIETERAVKSAVDLFLTRPETHVRLELDELLFNSTDAGHLRESELATRTLATLLRTGALRGKVRADIDVDIIASALVHYVMRVRELRIFRGKRGDRKDSVERVITELLRLLRPHDPKRDK